MFLDWQTYFNSVRLKSNPSLKIGCTVLHGCLLQNQQCYVFYSTWTCHLTSYILSLLSMPVCKAGSILLCSHKFPSHWSTAVNQVGRKIRKKEKLLSFVECNWRPYIVGRAIRDTKWNSTVAFGTRHETPADNGLIPWTKGIKGQEL